MASAQPTRPATSRTPASGDLDRVLDGQVDPALEGRDRSRPSPGESSRSRRRRRARGSPSPPRPACPGPSPRAPPDPGPRPGSAVAVTGKLTRWPIDDGVTDVDLDRAGEPAGGRPRPLAASLRLGDRPRPARNRPRRPSRSAVRPRANGRDLLADQRLGRTVGVGSPSWPVSGKTVGPAGRQGRIRHRRPGTPPGASASERGHRRVDVLLGHPRELLAVPPAGRLGIRDLEEERVLAARDAVDRVRVDVAVRAGLDRRDLDAGSRREDGQADQLGSRHRDRDRSSGSGRRRRCDTMLPAAIVFELVGSRFSNRTVPVALVSSTRLPVAGNVSSTATGTVTSFGGNDRTGRIRGGGSSDRRRR